MLRRSFLVGSAATLACARGSQGRGGGAGRSFMARRAAHPTRLLRRGPAPGSWQPQRVPAGARALVYRSGGRELKAWFAAPAGGGPAPGLVYFHGEFSLATWDFEQVRGFLDAGFAVLTPSLRGENGNPGDFELLRGELDDACAAVRWLAAQPGVDPTRISTVGHSVGGGLSALLALVPELPLVATASVDGIYTPATFARWAADADTRDLVRFDPYDREETELRVLGPHLAGLVRPHHAIVGSEDTSILRNARALAERAPGLGAPFTLQVVPGDHSTSLQPALRAHLAALRARS